MPLIWTTVPKLPKGMQREKGCGLCGQGGRLVMSWYTTADGKRIAWWTHKDRCPK